MVEPVPGVSVTPAAAGCRHTQSLIALGCCELSAGHALRAPRNQRWSLPSQEMPQTSMGTAGFSSIFFHRVNLGGRKPSGANPRLGGGATLRLGFSSGSAVQNWSAKARDERRGFHPWVGKTPGGGHGNPLQNSCLENPMDRGAWRATVHGVTKTRLSDLARTHSCSKL